MKILLQLSLLGVLSTVGSTSALAKYVPARISYDDLVSGIEINGDDIFWKSLHEVGLLSVTNIPDFNKEQMLKDLEDCLHRQKGVGAPDFNMDHLTAGDHHTSDGGNGSFRRRTLATRTLSGSPEGILVATKSQRDVEENKDNIVNDNMCGDIQASSQIFRNAVQGVSEAVAARFGSMESLAIDGVNNHKISIETLINKGEHLEHFHSYFSENNKASTTMDTTETTIDWHTDQGMMLLFTPGQFQDGTTSNGFFIRLADGSTAEVAFDSEIDDLVIMLGDGVNQYINGNDAPLLRAVPHAVTLPNESNSSRLWYGRMVLPPPNAIHPSGQGSTFEDIRTAMIQGDKDALSLGCATSNISARELTEHHFEGDEDEMGCDIDVSLLCWMTCMSYEKKNVSVESCASQSEDHKLVCANEDGELWEMGKHNPAYSLRCLSSEEIQQSGMVMDIGMDKDMEHDHSDMEMTSGAAGSVLFRVTTGLLGMMMVAMV